MKKILDVFKAAKEKGLKDVSIRISENQYGGLKCVLYVGSVDRMGGNSLKLLCEMLSDHEDLSWMNEKTK